MFDNKMGRLAEDLSAASPVITPEIMDLVNLVLTYFTVSKAPIKLDALSYALLEEMIPSTWSLTLTRQYRHGTEEQFWRATLARHNTGKISPSFDNMTSGEGITKSLAITVALLRGYCHDLYNKKKLKEFFENKEDDTAA